MKKILFCLSIIFTLISCQNNGGDIHAPSNSVYYAKFVVTSRLVGNNTGKTREATFTIAGKTTTFQLSTSPEEFCFGPLKAGDRISGTVTSRCYNIAGQSTRIEAYLSKDNSPYYMVANDSDGPTTKTDTSISSVTYVIEQTGNRPNAIIR